MFKAMGPTYTPPIRYILQPTQEAGIWSATTIEPDLCVTGKAICAIVAQHLRDKGFSPDTRVEFVKENTKTGKWYIITLTQLYRLKERYDPLLDVLHLASFSECAPLAAHDRAMQFERAQWPEASLAPQIGDNSPSTARH